MEELKKFVKKQDKRRKERSKRKKWGDTLVVFPHLPLFSVETSQV